MTIVTEGKNSFFISTPVKLLDLDHDTAADWASQHIIANPAIRWIVGKYVEADNANSNGQQWSLEDLRQSQSSIRHTPMNLAHKSRNIVGTFVASEMIYPDYADANPYIETLGAFWKYYFPEELAMVETAYQMDALYQSMECISESVTCAGPNGCGQTFDYAGPMSESYCEHILSRESSRQLNKPLFLAGALIYPPDRPGWKNASVNELSQISSLISDEAKHDLIKSIAQESPTLSPKEWEFMMFRILEQTFSDASQENDISRSLDDLNLVPTDGMVAEAKKGLAWRDEYNRGGTSIGIARGRDIANRKRLSPDTVMRMHSFFSRHEVDKKGQGFSSGEGFPSNGRIAWALWGGDPGQAWARKLSGQIQEIRKGS